MSVLARGDTYVISHFFFQANAVLCVLATNTYYMHFSTVLIFAVIPDQTPVIAAEVKRFSDQFTFVLTSGGVGPTHDDVTFEGIAAAFQDSVQRHPKLVQIIDAWTAAASPEKSGGSQTVLKQSEARYKLAEIPSVGRLNFASQERVAAAKLKGIEVVYPLVSVHNVFVFPGIPFLLRKSFDNIAVDLIETKLLQTAATTDKNNSIKSAVVAEVFVTQSEWFITGM